MLSDHTCCYSLRFFLARQLLTVIIVIIVITRLLSRYYTAVTGTAISTIIFAVFSLFSLFLVRLITCYYFLIILIILLDTPISVIVHVVVTHPVGFLLISMRLRSTVIQLLLHRLF